MTDTSVSIQGSSQRAQSEGTTTRGQTKKSLQTFKLVGLSVAAVLAIVAVGYDIFSGSETERSNREEVAVSSIPTQPPRLTDGMILDLNPGQSKLVVLAGRIKVVNYHRGHCMAFTPNNAAKREYNENQNEAWVTPVGSSESLVIITKLRPGESMNGKRCPFLHN